MSVKAKEVSYNIPGCGSLSTFVFPYTYKLYDFFSFYGHDVRLEKINQLGRIRDIFPGAHHNRYEYIFLQWTLISELIKLKLQEGLNTNRDFFGKLDEMSEYPTSAEILQCLVILSNIGHFQGTFASNRAILFLLKNERGFYKNFKNGLEYEDQTLLDKVIDEYKFYQLQHLVSLFLLKRYKQRGGNYTQFSTQLLRAYLNKKDTNVHLLKIWSLFENIRRISYLTLDAYYSPVPFSIDLATILLNIDQLYEEIIFENSVFQNALLELEIVLQNTIYLSKESCLNTTRTTHRNLDHLYESFLSKKLDSISDLKKFLCPKDNEPFEQRIKIEPDWDKRKSVLLKFSKIKDFEPNQVFNPVAWELEKWTYLGKSFARISMISDPSGSEIRIAFGLRNNSPKNELITACKAMTVFTSFSKSFKKGYINPHEIENGTTIIRMVLRCVFTTEKKILFNYQFKGPNPVVIERGIKKYENKVIEYLDSINEKIDPDTKLEVDQMKNLGNSVGFSGQMIGFLGSTKLLSMKDNSGKAEFDGILLLPSRVKDDYFLYILEAKNYAKGFQDAKKQLEERLSKNCPDFLLYKIETLNDRGAYAKIKIKQLNNNKR